MKDTVIDFYLRPEKIQIYQENNEGLKVIVERKMFLGSKTRYILQNKDQYLIADVSNSVVNPAQIKEGQDVFAVWNSEDLLPVKK